MKRFKGNLFAIILREKRVGFAQFAPVQRVELPPDRLRGRGIPGQRFPRRIAPHQNPRGQDESNSSHSQKKRNAPQDVSLVPLARLLNREHQRGFSRSFGCGGAGGFARSFGRIRLWRIVHRHIANI